MQMLYRSNRERGSLATAAGKAGLFFDKCEGCGARKRTTVLNWIAEEGRPQPGGTVIAHQCFDS